MIEKESIEEEREYRKKESKELLLALMEFQKKAEGISLKKDIRNEYKNYSYADLTQVLEVIRKPLIECGLLLSQRVEGEAMITTLTHIASGQKTSMAFPLYLDGKTMQALGAAITYSRRYSLITMLGLAAEDDDAEPVKQYQPITTEKLVNQAEKMAEKMAKPDGDEAITGILIDKKVKTGVSKTSGKPWTVTDYIIDSNGQRRVISKFGSPDVAVAGDVLTFKGITTSYFAGNPQINCKEIIKDKSKDNQLEEEAPHTELPY